MSGSSGTFTHSPIVRLADLSLHRNLTLGAKAELASGKHVTYLDDETRLQLIQLLNGSRTLPV